MNEANSVSILIQKPPKFSESYTILLCLKSDLKTSFQCCKRQLFLFFCSVCRNLLVWLCKRKREKKLSQWVKQKDLSGCLNEEKKLTSAFWTVWSFFPHVHTNNALFFFFVWLYSGNHPVPVSPHCCYCKKLQLSFGARNNERMKEMDFWPKYVLIQPTVSDRLLVCINRKIWELFGITMEIGASWTEGIFAVVVGGWWGRPGSI